MKTKDVAKQYGLDYDDFEMFCEREPSIQLKWGAFSNSIIEDGDVQRVVTLYRQHLADEEEKKLAAQKEALEQKEAAAKAAQEKKDAMTNMLITSGFSFDGYKITKYSGYISGDDATQIPRSGVFGGNNGQNLTDALVKIRIQAIKELKEAAYDLGCNAVIGVDFDYITLEPETANLGGGTLYEPYIICVTANGNAVVIEKE